MLESIIIAAVPSLVAAIAALILGKKSRKAALSHAIGIGIRTMLKYARAKELISADVEALFLAEVENVLGGASQSPLTVKERTSAVMAMKGAYRNGIARTKRRGH